MSFEKEFLKESEKKTFDIKRRHQISQSTYLYQQAHNKSLHQFKDYDLAKSRAAYVKSISLENLGDYLLSFEEKFQKRGGQVIWAETIEEAQQAILQIAQDRKIRKASLAQSATLAEINIKDFLERHSLQVLETALKEFVHPEEASASAPSTQAHIEMLRNKMFATAWHADLVLTGANFLIGDIGAVAISENEGNIRLASCAAKVHIVVAGIEKILPRLQDVDLFWPLLASSAQGQNISIYNSIFAGPRQENEKDGAEAMYVILLDNKRTEVLAQTDLRPALQCIQCGACHQVCPVYQQIGSETYGTSHTGPIGAVLSPHLEDFKKLKHLSFASTLCGACAQVCPVKIDLPKLLRHNREKAIQGGLNKRSEKTLSWFWQRAMKKRQGLNAYSLAVRKFLFSRFFKKSWGKRRELPPLAKKSFKQQWLKRSK